MFGAAAVKASHRLAKTVKKNDMISSTKALGSECKLALQNSRSFCNLTYLNMALVPTIPYGNGTPGLAPCHTKSIKRVLIIEM